MCCHSLTLETIVERNQEIDVTDLDGEKVMMDLEQGRYYTLNGVGGVIWDLLEIPLSLASIVQKLMACYEVNEDECEQAVKNFIHQMLHQNLVEIQH